VSREVLCRLSRWAEGGSEDVGPEIVLATSLGRSRAGWLSKAEVEVQ